MAIILDGTTGVTTPSILNSNANGVGNIGNSSVFFNTAFVKATSAQYADVAEKYQADCEYFPGTVLILGGIHEVTSSKIYADTNIAGVVSSNPALIMNASHESQYSVIVALLGRVPCRVIGLIKKGDLITSSNIPGVACALAAIDYKPGCVIGKALADYGSDTEGYIEILIGRL